MNQIYRILILVSISLSALWYYQPYSVFYDSSVVDAYSWIGYGANLWVIQNISPILLVSLMISQIGMLFFIKLSREAFLLLCITNMLLTPFIGLSVQSWMDNLIYYILSMLDGVILYMSYFSSVRESYGKYSDVT